VGDIGRVTVGANQGKLERRERNGGNHGGAGSDEEGREVHVVGVSDEESQLSLGKEERAAEAPVLQRKKDYIGRIETRSGSWEMSRNKIASLSEEEYDDQRKPSTGNAFPFQSWARPGWLSRHQAVSH
jgi:hypothetical protein